MNNPMTEITIPDKKAVEKTIKSIFRQLFPATHSYSENEYESNPFDSKKKLIIILSGLVDDKEKIADQFFDNLDNIKTVLLKDANFIFDSDPAAKQVIEVIAIYPGFFAIFCYRMAHSLSQSGVPLLPRMITEYAHKVTGIDIHPGAEIGSPFSIDHGTGIVIGETTLVGKNVKIYQGVTLGALSVEKSKASEKRHPTIEDNVIIYAGTTILGGGTIVGRNSIIGGNVWLTASVPPFSVVYHERKIKVRNQNDFEEPINFII